uniref:Uncharacterized protein n=1 Tax=Anguilla anguilla TaxID=7936 RepID=A0A0E9WPE3_ANGAN
MYQIIIQNTPLTACILTYVSYGFGGTAPHEMAVQRTHRNPPRV